MKKNRKYNFLNTMHVGQVPQSNAQVCKKQNSFILLPMNLYIFNTQLVIIITVITVSFCVVQPYIGEFKMINKESK